LGFKMPHLYYQASLAASGFRLMLQIPLFFGFSDVTASSFSCLGVAFSPRSFAPCCHFFCLLCPWLPVPVLALLACLSFDSPLLGGLFCVAGYHRKPVPAMLSFFVAPSRLFVAGERPFPLAPSKFVLLAEFLDERGG